MKTSKDDIYEHMKETYDLENEQEIHTSDFVDMVLESLVDLELPHLEDELEQYEGSNFTTFGKIKLLESIQDEVS